MDIQNLNDSGKKVVFLEPPKPELWDLLKPILSHDTNKKYQLQIGSGRQSESYTNAWSKKKR
jgi:hypothetical protein